MNEEEKEAPLEDPCIRHNLLPERSTLLNLRNNMQRMPANGQLKELHAVLCELRQMPANMQLKELHAVMCKLLWKMLRVLMPGHFCIPIGNRKCIMWIVRLTKASESNARSVATPLWPSVGVKPNTSKVGDLESFGIPECLEFDSKAWNTSHWGVLGVIGKRSWSVDIENGFALAIWTSATQVMGKRRARVKLAVWLQPLKVGNRPLPNIRFESATRSWKDLDEGYKFGSDLVMIRLRSRELWAPKVPRLHPGQFRDNFGTPTWESQEKEPLRCSLGGEAQRIL
jgi:hypothetical protein